VKKLTPKLLLLLGLAAITGSFPYYGYSQMEIPQDPRAFLDATTKKPIENVLIIPRFSTSVGISSGAGHGPGWGTHSIYVAHPFTYKTGTPFAITQERSAGFSLGFFMAWVGQGHFTEGMLVIAPGYKSLWVWDLWGNFDHFKHELLPLSRKDISDELTALQTLLDKELIEGSDNERRWSVGNGLRIACAWMMMKKRW
jgi:hypothetical protein